MASSFVLYLCLITLLLLVTETLSAPVEAHHHPAPAQTCTNIKTRVEWRSLSDSQKSDYFKAVLCLQKQPPRGQIKAARTRFDDFQAAHQLLADEIHFVGQFLPWHRRFLNVYEKALREECRYNGPIPYWDWSIDADSGKSVKDSPLWDPNNGFGGNGKKIKGYAGPFGNFSNLPGWKEGTGGGCIKDGPFSYYQLSIGPGSSKTKHCLTRDFNDIFLEFMTTEEIEREKAMKTFETFRLALEGDDAATEPRESFGSHGAGHFAVGAEMSSRYSSPGDPIFYLHHANLDRIWWQWQQQDLDKRLKDISGRSTVDPPHKDITLKFKLKMLNLAPLVTIEEIMDIRNNLLCYNYDK